MRKTLFIINLFLFSLFSSAQVGINTENPAPSSILDIQSTNKGVLLPRVALASSSDIVTIVNPAKGLLVYNTGTGGLKTEGLLTWNGIEWVQFTTGTSKSAAINGLDCVNARIQPNRYKAGEAYSGVLIIPYTGGNGGYYSSGNPISSTGVTGLTATLQPGNLAYGNGDLIYTLEGTPSESSPSLASFEIDFLGQSCTAQVGANSLQQGEQTYWHGSMAANVGGANVLASNYIDDLPVIEDIFRMDAQFPYSSAGLTTVTLNPRIYNVSGESVKVWASSMSSQEGFGYSNITIPAGDYLQFDNGVYLWVGNNNTSSKAANNGQETVTIDLFYKERWYRLYYTIWVDNKNLAVDNGTNSAKMVRELYLSIHRLY